MGQFTEAQLGILEQYWNRRQGAPRPPQHLSLYAAIDCSDVGPPVTSQDVGRYFSNRVAQERGRPRARAPTPAQLRLLKEEFLYDPYPDTATTIILTWQTGLRGTQVKSWFEYRRRKFIRAGKLLFSLNDEQDPGTAASMWRQYRKNPHAYARMLYMNQPTGQFVGAEREAEWDSKWGENDEDGR
ncbi:hypothetical protein F5B20DRAFT_581110 [Whalleya microplaca]|nr:hypothetical protein F5B20DRAFT_581110 [Whalleya microplaca]